MPGASFLGQFVALTKKNFLIKSRNKGPLLQEILYPIYFTAILAMIKHFTQLDPEGALNSGNLTVYHLKNTSLSSGKVLAVYPDSRFSHSLMSNVSDIMSKSTSIASTKDIKYFSQQSELQTYCTTSSNCSAGIIFEYGSSASAYSYAIRVDFASAADTKSWTRDQGQCRKSGDCEVKKYINSGFYALQTIIDTALARYQLDDPDFPVPNLSVQLLPKPAFQPSASYVQTISAIYFVIAYSPFVNYLVVALVNEKEKKIKEGMKMMGMRDSAFWLSWGLVYLCIMTLCTVISVVITYAAGFFGSSSNVFILFLILMFYGLSIITMSCMFTPFFSKARSAGGLASMSTIIFSLGYLIVSLTRTQLPSGELVYSVSPAVQWIMSLISPIAVALAIDQAIYLDVSGGMTFSTMDKGVFPLYAPMLMLIIDSILYFLLAVYLDNVMPGEYGAKQHPLYFLSKSYWFPKAQDSSLLDNMEEGETHDGDVEPVTSDLREKVAIRVKDLSKEFKSSDGPVKAVDGLSLDMYEGHITALLGHNGAGKTTLVNILTGLVPPTSGRAYIMGLDVRNGGNMNKIQSMCGVCPQTNILFDDLTSLEHLKLYAAIKGVPSDQVEREALNALENVGLSPEKNTRSNKLSGGQKRKLSVAMALIGDPKVIFLDEPTAGMDPFSRRQLWATLKERRKGRVIVLTTHFMDEADILADRKAIISKGHLRCCGSSLFLKSKFGIGYHLNMVTKDNFDKEGVTEVISRHVEGSELGRTHGKEVSYILPLPQVKHFAGLFSYLDKESEDGNTQAQKLGIKSYGVAMTTLEEVFLKLEDDGNDGKDMKLSEIALSPKKPILGSRAVSYSSINVTEEDERYNHGNVDLFDTQGKIPIIESPSERLRLQILALMKVKLLKFWRIKALFFFGLIMPVVFVVIGMVLGKYGTNTPDNSSPTVLSVNESINRYKGHGLLLNDLVGTTESENFIDNHIKDKYKTQSFTNIDNHSITEFNFGIKLQTFTTTGGQFNMKYLGLVNDSAIHSLPAVISIMSNAILEEAAATVNKTYHALSAFSWPFPEQKKNLPYDQSSSNAVILLGMAFIIIPTGFIPEIVQDRELKIKGQLRVSGMTFNMYWIASFIFDIGRYLIPTVLSVLLLLIFEPGDFDNADAIGCFILVCLLYMPSMVIMGYNVNFLFKKTESAVVGAMLIFFLAGFLPYLAVSIVDAAVPVDPGKTPAAEYIHYVVSAVDPPYLIFGGIYYISRVSRISSFTKIPSTTSDYFSGPLLMVIFMAIVHTIIGVILLRFLDFKSTSETTKGFLCGNKESNSVKPRIQRALSELDHEDDDVRAERTRVNNMNKLTTTSVAICENLRKEFTENERKTCKKVAAEKKKVAVHNTTFAVDAGEIFGLLGPNGAGKTTTINMMIAETGTTHGRVTLGGYDIRSSVSEAFSTLGYCPQHDALWTDITLQEHIECFAAIRGIPKDVTQSLIHQYMKKMKIDEHKKKVAKTLSGGTKRKLCYILSMLGRPKIVLMDEPSTGMDPRSKRYLWDTITESFIETERGAILTTHYMEEADALCSRLAIMVNGKLQCLGPTQHLKNKFGSGYVLEVKLKVGQDEEYISEKMTQLENHLRTLFPGMVCLEKFEERGQFKIPKEDVKSLAETFTALENAKDEHNLEEYNFSQSTLEQVFLDFAKKQKEEGVHVGDEAEVEPGVGLNQRATPTAELEEPSRVTYAL